MSDAAETRKTTVSPGALAECVDGIPNICGSESLIAEARRAAGERPVFHSDQAADPLAGIEAAFAIALHMHQPLIPAGGSNLRTRSDHQQPEAHDGAPGHRRQPQRRGVPLVL